MGNPSSGELTPSDPTAIRTPAQDLGARLLDDLLMRRSNARTRAYNSMVPSPAPAPLVDAALQALVPALDFALLDQRLLAIQTPHDLLARRTAPREAGEEEVRDLAHAHELMAAYAARLEDPNDPMDFDTYMRHTNRLAEEVERLPSQRSRTTGGGQTPGESST